ncbi:MAG TPA: hypothetical protein VFH73_21605 [Polyangia bacterium]|jgi:hypothetical protein|nr:hypothetical protein [Polyangia bacterium]
MALIAGLGRRSAGFWFAVVFAVAAVCTLPALTAGFYADDFLHLAKLQSGGSAAGRLTSMFTFTTGGAETRDLIADGTVPWWTSPRLHIQFFRPLSAALMLLDHAVFALRPLGYHLHSIFWWLLWLAGTALLFRRLLSPRLALLAFAIFAIDDAHWLPIGWIAARNAPVAMACVVWGLLAYVRFREDGWRPGAVLALGAWALALLAGEVALSGLMYVLAYELLRDRASGIRAVWVGLRPLLPLGLLLVGYAVVYRVSGAGVRGSGAYINPIHDSAPFIAAAAARVPAQFGALMVGAPLDLWLLTPLQPIFVAVGLAAILVAVPWFVTATKALPASDRKGARWLALGSAVSLVPTSAGLLGERSLAAASLGAAVMVAVLLRHGWKRMREVHGIRRVAVVVGVLALGIPNLVVAAPWLVGKLAFMSVNGKALERVASTAETAAPPPARAVLLWSDDPLLAAYTATLARITHLEALPSFRVLAMAPVDLLMTRTAPDELELSCAGGSLLISEWERLFRAPEQPLPAGTELPLKGVTVRIVEDLGGRPTRVRFQFDVPLDDPSLRFLEWRGRRLVPAALPALGETRPVYRSPPLLTAAP